MTDTLARARDLRTRGLCVIPVPRPGDSDGKVPTIAWGEFQTRLPTEDELVAWFGREPMNLAVVTGAISDVVVVDVDNREALRWAVRHLSYTPWQTQTSKGFHLWYRHPGDRVANRVGVETEDGRRLAIDVRGDGGYVIAPGSLHASGVTYRFAGDWSVPRDQVPRFWAGWLPRRVRSAPASSLPRPTGDIHARARRYLAAIPRPVIGAGSDSQCLYAACRLVRGFALSAADAEALLWEWAGDRPGWTRAWITRKVAHAERYGSEPLGGLVVS